MNPIERVPVSFRRSVRRNGRNLILRATLARRQLQRDRTLPDFVIVGAQRCGTTSLFHALAHHPAVMANVLNAKGVHYFDTSYHQSLDWYRAHFPTADERSRHEADTGQPAIVGEASPYYLFHPIAIERMRADVPDAKLIVLLRDPARRAISHHQHMVWEGHEPVENLGQALDLEAERLAGESERLASDPSYRSPEHQHFGYVARGQYADQLERLFNFYPRDQVLVLATEHLTSEPASHLADIQRFIGLDPAPGIGLERRNASSRDKTDPATVQRLRDAFAASNQRLADIIDVDLPWT